MHNCKHAIYWYDEMQLDCAIFNTVDVQICEVCPEYSGDSRGVGDTVARVLSKIGVKASSSCKCGQRKNKLNNMIPYRDGNHGQ